MQNKEGKLRNSIPVKLNVWRRFFCGIQMAPAASCEARAGVRTAAGRGVFIRRSVWRIYFWGRRYRNYEVRK
jgi:hypothetical protein